MKAQLSWTRWAPLLLLAGILGACGAAVSKTTAAPAAPAPAQPAEPAPAEPQATCDDLAIRLLDRGAGIHGAIVADILHLGGATAPVTCSEPANQSVAGWSIPDDWTAQVQQSQYYLIVVRYPGGNRLYIISRRGDGTTCIVDTNDECVAEVSALPDDFDLSELPDDVAPTIPAGRPAPPTTPAPDEPAVPAGAPPEPYDPRPRRGAAGVTVMGPQLSWSAARHGMAEATSFDLYWGTTQNLAADAALGTPITTSYTPIRIWRQGHPAPWRERWLEGETIYYWRVDAKNDAGTTRGPVWYFTTGPTPPGKPRPPEPTPPVKPTPPEPTPPATPPPATPPLSTQEIGAADFGSDSLDSAGKASSRSTPYAVDGVTADNLDRVRVSIGGKTLPFTSTARQPAFAGDTSAAEWRVSADVSAGADGTGSVVLMLTATESAGGRIERIVVAGGGAYTSLPNVRIAPPALASGARATATVGDASVASVIVSLGGIGYTSAPTVTISAPASGTTATATAEIQMYDQVSGVKITNDGLNPGSGYTGFLSGGPTITFSAPPAGGTQATAHSVGAGLGWVSHVVVTDRGANLKPNIRLPCEFSAPAPGLYTFHYPFYGEKLPSVRALGEAHTNQSGQVAGVRVSYPGLFYTSVPTFTCSYPDSVVQPTLSVVQPAFTVRMYNRLLKVKMTNLGSGYTSVPTVTISGDATGIAYMRGNVRTNTLAMQDAFAALGRSSIHPLHDGGVTITEPGSGYKRQPPVTFSAPSERYWATLDRGAIGWRAAGYATLAVSAVTIKNPGSGYKRTPAVTFTGGRRPPCLYWNSLLHRCAHSFPSATATAVLADGYDASENLSRARQALAGKQLVVRLVDAPPAADGNG